SFEAAVIHRVASRLKNDAIALPLIVQAFHRAVAADPGIATALRTDITAVYEFDPACERFIEPFLYFKGFHAIQAHRLTHWLWVNGERDFCGYLQSRSSEVFQTDIHPAARFGQGIFLDHATGLSAPHSYATDRLCVGVSGTWWVNSGAAFEPENTRPAASSAVSPALGITTA